MSVATMSTSDGATPLASSSDVVSGFGSEAALALGVEIGRLANQFFSVVPRVATEAPPAAAALPASASPITGLHAAASPAALGSPGALAPPRFGPHALAVGGGGASPAVTAAPVPGFVKQPPLSVAPPPKESDLRAIPAILFETAGLPSPAGLSTAPEPLQEQPYFIALAGLPSAGGPSFPGGPPHPGGTPSAFAGSPPSGTISGPSSGLPGQLPVPEGAPWSAAATPRSATSGVSPAGGAGSSVEPFASTPYFLDVAGPPAASTSAPGAAPGVPSSAFPPFAAPGSPGVPTGPSIPLSVAASAAAVPAGFPSLPRADAERTPVATPGLEGQRVTHPTAPTYGFYPDLVADPPSTGRIFDGATIKKDFPILQERVHGRPLVWLDNAATTQKPQVVIDRISYYYEHENSNVHRAAHALAARATDAYESARDTVRRFLNAPSAHEIVFLRGTTEAINLVAKSWGRRNVAKGDEIVITWLEHHANIVPWQQLCSETGACLRVAPVDDRGQVILEEYEKLLGPKTRLVSVSQVSNALGTIVPVREMIEMAHRHGALAVVDGAQAVSHMKVDVQALDCDFYCFSGHKIFAPTGIGVLYGKRVILDAMPPWQGGGNMISDVTFEKTTYQPAPMRFEAGTGSLADAVGLGAALDYVTALGQENVRRYEHELLVYATEGLARVRGLRMIGTAPDKAGVLSFVLDGVRTEDVGAALDQEGIAVRSGHHCAQPILRRFGLESSVRASLAPYNTCDDVDALVAALLRIQAGAPIVKR
jgi:cysteine desulfurase/selenocysteine lyase